MASILPAQFIFLKYIYILLSLILIGYCLCCFDNFHSIKALIYLRSLCLFLSLVFSSFEVLTLSPIPLRQSWTFILHSPTTLFVSLNQHIQTSDTNYTNAEHMPCAFLDGLRAKYPLPLEDWRWAALILPRKSNVLLSLPHQIGSFPKGRVESSCPWANTSSLFL